ncbi:PRC-barrel domain-containing protein [Marinomonas polaris DSM 16579]|uniref:PRC-barrel domain-containing protein n=1 Tax=Marinomonas polaris DSM 16579 TaxID=1122206 RepID=A0A1M5ABL9_9GAMM|nr:PRC-barrel domain-containing protein [Marinomonas polaris]SHF27565.1 PRC-barrel domain-containing protein [Marinomonas polaris DSM 16579]
MLRSMHDLERYTIAATDGNVGEVTDFLFDDEEWVVRYFVVETGSWLSSRKVLISPIGIEKANWRERVFPVSITKEQVKNSPKIDTDQPVSRQHEIDHLGYYGYPYYWGGTGFWGGGMYPYSLYPGFGHYPDSKEESDNATLAHEKAKRELHQNDDPNLRSCKAIIGYKIHAIDGEMGHVSGLLIEDNTMAVRYFMVDTTNWFGGHKVLISPEWIEDMDWTDNSVTINLTRHQIKEAPEYHTTKNLNREHELAVYDHYGLTGYWARGEKANLVKQD